MHLKLKAQLGHRCAEIAAIALALSCLVSESVAQDLASEAEVELREAKVALAALQDQIAGLQESVVVAESQVKALGEGLAAANAESIEFQEAYRKIRLQLEALGVAVLDGGADSLEQRLLQAVNDCRLLQEEKSRLGEEVLNLSEVIVNTLNSSVGVDPAAQELAENAMKRAEAILALQSTVDDGPELPTAQFDAPLQNAKVISVKADYGLILFNVGSEHGVRVGMPFRVVRKERLIGTVLVVDVRTKICGAVIQQLESEEPFAVGDVGRVAAEQQDNF